MVWWTQEEYGRAREWLYRASPWLLIALFIFIVAFIVGYKFKGTEIVNDCKYANAFRVDYESFTCTRKI